MFLQFCEMPLLELVSGDFWGKGAFLGSIPTCSFEFLSFYLQLVSVVFWGVREII